MNTSTATNSISSTPLDTGALADRLATCAKLLSSLPVQPEGPCLLFEVPETREVRSLPLYLGEVIIGRVPLTPETPEGSHLAFPESKKLSSRHFAIRRQGEDFILNDLGSKNGTYVNTGANPIKTKTLASSDCINAGGIVFAFIDL